MNPISIELSPSVYSIQAVKNTCYDFSGSAWIEIKIQEESCITVILEPKDNSIGIKNEFMNRLLDHQVRIDTAKEFKIIREMIVAQAFEPCDNLSEVVEYILNDNS